MVAAAVLSLEHVSHRFGSVAAVCDVSLAVAPGERRVILGANGAGKTTLFNVISGDLHPSSGEVRLFGRNVNRLPVERRIRLGMRRTYQTSLVFSGLTVRECLFLALRGVGTRRFAAERRAAACPEMAEADRIAESVGLANVLGALAGELSHGERRQLEIGMASVGQPCLLLLDEPAAGLSSVERRRLLDALRVLPRSVALLMIEHDVDLALAIADRVTFLHNGELITEGTPAEIESDARIHDIYMGKHAL
jgi:branched-chain amino acid transport system ATP-binding protein